MEPPDIAAQAKSYASTFGWTITGKPILHEDVGWSVSMTDVHGSPQTVYFGNAFPEAEEEESNVFPIRDQMMFQFGPPPEAQPEKETYITKDTFTTPEMVLSISRPDVRGIQITANSKDTQIVVELDNERARWLAEQIINLLGITLKLPVNP